MKKIITILLVLGISLNTYSQTWNEIFSNDMVTVETTVVECNPTNKQYPFSYLLVKYTNKTSEIVNFEFEYELYYNDVLHPHVGTDAGDEPAIKHVELQPNEVREGDCRLHSETYRIFYKNNHPKMDQKLTQITLKEHKTK